MTKEIEISNKKQNKGNPNWHKGMESPNPDGKPEGTKNYLKLLEEALEKQAKIEGKSYWDKLAQWSFRNPSVAVSILKKYVPDKTQTEITTPEPIEIKIIYDDNKDS
jgi:hypothetical protein